MEHRESIPAASTAVFAQLVSEEFLVAFGAEVGVTTKSAVLSSEGDAQRAVLVWAFSTDRPGIPALARKFLSDEVELTWDQVWAPSGDDGFSGTLVVTLDGKPGATSQGRSTLRTSGGGSVLVTDTTTRTTLPRMVSMGIESTIDKELVGWILSVQTRVLRRRLGVS
jgi:hypothetical protein